MAYDPPNDPYGSEKLCRFCDAALETDWMREWYCPNPDCPKKAEPKVRKVNPVSFGVPRVVDIRQCEITPGTPLVTVVDWVESGALWPVSVYFDDLDVAAQCRVLNEWFALHWNSIEPISF